jgi:hypothetical protein
MAQNVQNEQQALTLVKKNAAAIGLTDQKIINHVFPTPMLMRYPAPHWFTCSRHT